MKVNVVRLSEIFVGFYSKWSIVKVDDWWKRESVQSEMKRTEMDQSFPISTLYHQSRSIRRININYEDLILKIKNIPAMRLYLIIALLWFPFLKGAPLPPEMADMVYSFLPSEELFKLRTVNREFKDQVELYAKRNIKVNSKFGFIRDWQLSHVLTGNADLRQQLYSPISSRNHMKLLKFIANYLEFDGIYCNLRADVIGFLKPMMKYYGSQIHGLEEFINLFDCDYLSERVSDDYEDWIGSELLFLITGLKCLQG